MKKSFLSLVLAFAMSMSIGASAWAVDTEAQAISKLADYNFVQRSNLNEATITINDEQIFVQNLSEVTPLSEVDKVELTDAIEHIASVRDEEFDSETDIINYVYMADDKTYFYEEARDDISDVDSKLFIYDTNTEANDNWVGDVIAIEAAMNENTEDNELTPQASSTSLTIYNSTSPLDKGVAARLNINNSAISYMQASVTVPTIAQMNGVNNTNILNYIYLGFSGSNVESDIGLASARLTETSTTLCGFKPYFLLKNSGVTDEGEKEYQTISGDTVGSVQYYLPSTSSVSRTIDLYVYKNVNGMIRGTVYGSAVYGANSQQAKVKTIMDSSTIKSSALKPISKWKAVNTLTPKSGSIPSGTRSQCVFKNFLVNGKDLALSSCDAVIYNKGNTSYGNISATYKNNTYLDTLTFILKP